MDTIGDGCCPVSEPCGRCVIEAVLSVDERGQVVLPKELRMRAGIGAGEKLAAIGWEKEGRICCIMLYPVKQLEEPVKAMVAPMFRDLLKGGE
ncbi:MAG: HgcAB-associated protein [Methanomicrobiales archaeon]|nr:HgcAB-associated protein [Methanomicrobiales archaeon]